MSTPKDEGNVCRDAFFVEICRRILGVYNERFLGGWDGVMVQISHPFAEFGFESRQTRRGGVSQQGFFRRRSHKSVGKQKGVILENRRAVGMTKPNE